MIHDLVDSESNSSALSMARRSDEKTTGPLVATLGSWTAPNGHANVWDYDTRSQVTKSEPLQLTIGGAISSTSTQINARREWTFDPIGNRTAEKRGSGHCSRGAAMTSIKCRARRAVA